MQQRASLASSTSNPQRFSVGAARTSRRPVLYSTSALVRDESSGSRSCRRPGAFGFPRLAHLLAPRQHIFLGIIEAFVNSRALDRVAEFSTLRRDLPACLFLKGSSYSKA